MSRPRARTRDIVVVGLLIAGLLAGTLLVIFGGGGSTAGSGTDTTDVPTPSIPAGDVSKAGVEEWSGLDFPDDATDFLTVRMGEGQLDVTFTMAPDDEGAFLADSGLPEPTPGERYVLHSSPLWKLNPGQDEITEGTEGSGAEAGEPPAGGTGEDLATTVAADPALRGTSNVYEDVRRSVELVDEAPGVVRARVVLTGAA